jgi:hypothetical protein
VLGVAPFSFLARLSVGGLLPFLRSFLLVCFINGFHFTLYMFGSLLLYFKAGQKPVSRKISIMISNHVDMLLKQPLLFEKPSSKK